MAEAAASNEEENNANYSIIELKDPRHYASGDVNQTFKLKIKPITIRYQNEKYELQLEIFEPDPPSTESTLHVYKFSVDDYETMDIEIYFKINENRKLELNFFSYTASKDPENLKIYVCIQASTYNHHELYDTEANKTQLRFLKL